MIIPNCSAVSTFVKSFHRQILICGLVVGSSSVLLLSGCSSALTKGLQGPSGDAVVASLHGKAHGGQFPVSGSTVKLYEVGATTTTATGYGSASTMIATADALTDSEGAWNISSFTCANSSDELYVVSSGGNPGLTPAVNNQALVLTAAIGTCSAVESGTPSFIYIDELTTVATAYALAGFSTDYLHIGTTKTNTVGLTNAFATFNNLVNVTNGQALTTTPAYATPPVSCTTTPTACTPYDTFRSIVPYDLINTLGNVLAGCVNSDGTTNCSNLFAITGGSIAKPSATITNTADAALYIAHNPGLMGSGGSATNNLTALFNLASVYNQFSPALIAVPNDYSMTVNFVAGGLGGVGLTTDATPYYGAIDQQGNIWVVDSGNYGVALFSNLGAPVTAATTINTTTTPAAVAVLGGFRPGSTRNAMGAAAIDLNGNLWVADTSKCLWGFDGASSSTPGALISGSPFSALCPNTGASQIAVDNNGDVWVMGVSAGASFLLSTDNAGNERFLDTASTNNFNKLQALAGADYTGHMWYIDGGNGEIGSVNLSNGGGYETSIELLATPTQYTALGPLAASVSGSTGTLTLWTPNPPTTGQLDVATIGDGTSALDVLATNFEPGTMTQTTGIVVDGGGNYYFANTVGTGLGQMSVPFNITASTDAGYPAGLLSPYYTGYTGGSALMALSTPNSLHIDQSGNLWVINQSNANTKTNDLAGGTYYAANGVNAGNLTEFIGFAQPVNPVFAQDAATGAAAMTAGATATSVMTVTGTYGNLP